LADRLGQSLEKETVSLEAILKSGSGDVFLTKTVNVTGKGRRETKL